MPGHVKQFRHILRVFFDNLIIDPINSRGSEEEEAKADNIFLRHNSVILNKRET